MKRRKMRKYILNQINQIRQGGLPVLAGKGRKFLLMAFTAPITLPIVLLVRLLRPLVVIRFEPLHSDRIGHFTAGMEMYLCERDAGMHSPRTFDIFYHSPPICNLQIKKMWERTGRLHIFPFPSFMQVLDRLNRLLPGGRRHIIVTSDRDIYGLRVRTKPYLSFTAQEEQFGRNELRKLGIPDGNPFVCFHARDSAYLETALPSRTSLSGGTWDYHNYRNSNIHNYIPAAEELVHRGYFAIRMGAIVKERLNTTNSRIIDYAVNNRTHLLDIFLGAKCRFFISSGCGIDAVPILFRRPIAWTNFIPLEYVPTWDKDCLFIPKKLWLRKEHRFLTFREILDSGIGRFVRSEEYEEFGIDLVENTPEEITALAVEMDERLKGTWQATEEDEELQRRFWAFFKPSEFNQIFLSGIGMEFLRQNRELLE